MFGFPLGRKKKGAFQKRREKEQIERGEDNRYAPREAQSSWPKDFFHIVVVQLLSHVQLCDPMNCSTHQASLVFSRYLIEEENVLLLPSDSETTGDLCFFFFFCIFQILKFYLFIFRCVGLHCCTQVFSSCSSQASHCNGFSCCRAWTLGCRLGFSGCSMWAQ